MRVSFTRETFPLMKKSVIMMRAFLVGLCGLMLVVSPVAALTPNLPAGSLLPGMVVQTRFGPMDCLVHTPHPREHFNIRSRGVYAADINVTSGTVYSVRVLQSSGDTLADNAARAALHQWQFRPRSIYKLVVPVDFIAGRAVFGGRG